MKTDKSELSENELVTVIKLKLACEEFLSTDTQKKDYNLAWECSY